MSTIIKSAADVSFTQTDAFKKAMDYMDSFVADDFTTPVPVNEDTKVVIAHNKYGYGKEPKKPHSCIVFKTISEHSVYSMLYPTSQFAPNMSSHL